ncbi:uncharacterized protein [Asterias amurensis]|uniref:uncharacterized protein n=1 Tax=Asterias amurensis TaxID=7602 RepID=UPI003AB6B7B8
MSSQSPSLPASGSSNPGQASTPTTPVNSSAEGKPNSKSPAARSAEKPSNPKVLVQPVNPPMSISLPVDAPQSMFTITQQKHMLETAKVPAAASVAPIIVCKASPTIPRPAISKTVSAAHPQSTNAQVTIAGYPVPGTQSVASTHPVPGTYVVQSTPTVVSSTHLLPTSYPVPSAQLVPSSQVRLPSTAPSGTLAVESQKLKVTGSTTQVATSGTQPGAVGGQAGHPMPQYVRTLPMPHGMIPGAHVAQGQVQQHVFPSHLPRGAVAAAAMSAPKSGLTTAILRTTSPVAQSQFPGTTAPLTSSAIQSPMLAGQQMQRYHHPSSQVHLPAQLQMSGKGHSPVGLAGVGTGLPGVGTAPTGPPGITRASSPAAATSLPSHLISSTEAHRVIPHSSLPQSHPQSAAHPFRPDIKQLSKTDKKLDGKADPKSSEPIKRMETKIEVRSEVKVDPRGEVKMIDPRSNYSWVPMTQHGNQKLQLSGTKYISQGMGLQRMSHPQVQVCHSGGNNVSSSLVTATTLSHHTVPSQSIIHSSIRTSAITVTTLSTQSQSVTTTSIPVAKVYPRQQMTHSARPSAAYVSETYMTTHRNSPNASVATTVNALPPAASLSDGRGERPPHPGAVAHSGHYPSQMSALYYDPMTNYRMYNNPAHNFPMSAAGVRSTLADPHIRHQMHPSPQQNNSVAAAVVAAAAHAATGGAPVRINPVSIMMDSRRPVSMHNPMGMGPALEGGNVHTSSTASMNIPQSSSSSPNPSASPRPSILKRRINDSVSIRKPVSSGSQPSSPSPKTELTRSTSSSPKHSDSLASSQHSMDSNTSEASLDILPSSIKVKQEHEILHSDTISQASLARDLSMTNSSSIVECSPSPRKKPRKQQHVVATEHHDILDDQSTDEETETKPKHFRIKKEKKEKKPAVPDLEHLNIVHFFRRPCLRLIDAYRQSWKPTHNHFERYTDVRPKEEKKSNIHEIANQRGIVKKTDGWKVRHITYQFEDLNGLEMDVFNQMKDIKEGMSDWQTPGKESDTSKIYELIQGNIQRSQYVMEHLEEAKTTMLKLLEHKPKVMGIIKTHANKRHAKKKHSP